MTKTVKDSQPKIKYKTFNFNTELEWVGKRSAILLSEGKEEFRVGSPPEFKGEVGVWSPEDLFVAAVDICTLTTFSAFSQRSNLPVVSYTSKAEGVLEFVDGGYRFTKIILKPTIFVETEEAIGQAEKTLHDAHRHCLIANSIKTAVIVEPNIKYVNLEE